MFTTFKNCLNFFNLMVVNRFQEAQDLVTEDPNSQKDDEIRNKLNEIHKLLDDKIADDNKYFELGTSKKEIINKWLGSDVDGFNDNGVVDKQVKELFDKLKVQNASKEEIQDSTISLLEGLKDNIENSLSIGGNTLDDDVANGYLDRDISKSETLDDKIVSEFKEKKLKEKLAAEKLAKEEALKREAQEKAEKEAALKREAAEKLAKEEALKREAQEKAEKELLEKNLEKAIDAFDNVDDQNKALEDSLKEEKLKTEDVLKNLDKAIKAFDNLDNENELLESELETVLENLDKAIKAFDNIDNENGILESKLEEVLDKLKNVNIENSDLGKRVKDLSNHIVELINNINPKNTPVEPNINGTNKLNSQPTQNNSTSENVNEAVNNEKIRKNRVNNLIKTNRNLVDNSGNKELIDSFKTLTKKGKTSHEEMDKFENVLKNYKDSLVKKEEAKSEQSEVQKNYDHLVGQTVELKVGDKVLTGVVGKNIEGSKFDYKVGNNTVTTLEGSKILRDNDIDDEFEDSDITEEERDSILGRKSVVEDIKDGAKEAGEYISDKYEQVCQWLNELLKDNETLGEFKTLDKKDLNIKFDKKSNSLYLDTPYFDGVKDYTIDISVRNINSIEDAKKFLEYNADIKGILEEYDNKVLDAKIKYINNQISDYKEKLEDYEVPGYEKIHYSNQIKRLEKELKKLEK